MPRPLHNLSISAKNNFKIISRKQNYVNFERGKKTNEQVPSFYWCNTMISGRNRFGLYWLYFGTWPFVLKYSHSLQQCFKMFRRYGCMVGMIDYYFSPIFFTIRTSLKKCLMKSATPNENACLKIFNILYDDAHCSSALLTTFLEYVFIISFRVTSSIAWQNKKKLRQLKRSVSYLKSCLLCKYRNYCFDVMTFRI